MASLEIELDLGPAMRDAMIGGLAGLIDQLPQYRFAVILELLRRDAVSRTMIAEALGELALKEAAQDAEAAALYEANKGEGCEPPAERSWDDLMNQVLAELLDTPGGRGEA